MVLNLEPFDGMFSPTIKKYLQENIKCPHPDCSGDMQIFKVNVQNGFGVMQYELEFIECSESPLERAHVTSWETPEKCVLCGKFAGPEICGARGFPHPRLNITITCTKSGEVYV